MSRTTEIPFFVIQTWFIKPAQNSAYHLIFDQTKSSSGTGKRNLCKLTAVDAPWINKSVFHYAEKSHEFLLFAILFIEYVTFKKTDFY